MAQIGFVGLGTMGGRMVERLLAKGHIVTGYNRTRAKAEASVVGDADGVVEILRAEERRYGAEEFFLVRGGIFGDVA